MTKFSCWDKMSEKHHQKIHRIIKERHPHIVHKAKRLFHFRYPKLFLLLLSMVLAYYLFKQPVILNWISGLNNLGYFGSFIAGLLLPTGFSSVLGVGFFLTAKLENLFLAVLIGGVGCMIADLLIFKLIKISFASELKQLEKTKIIHKIEKIVNKNKHILILHYLLYIFAGIILATPLPDEVGVSMLAGLTTIRPFKLAIISLLIHSTSIYLMLFL